MGNPVAAFFRDLGAVLKAMGSPSVHWELLARELWRGFRKPGAEDAVGSGFPSHDRLILLAMAGVGLAICLPKAMQSARDGSTVSAWLWGVPAALCGAVFVLFVIAAVVGAILDYISANCGRPVAAANFHHGSFWFALFFWTSAAWFPGVFLWPGSGWLMLGRALGVGALLGYPTGVFFGLYLGRMDGCMKKSLGDIERYVALPILILDLVACLPLLKV